MKFVNLSSFIQEQDNSDVSNTYQSINVRLPA